MKIRSMLVLLMVSAVTAFAQDAGKASPVTAVEVANEPLHQLKIENQYVRAYFVELAPGQSTLMHHHGTDYVAVAVGAAEVDSAGADGTTRHLVFQDGEVKYWPAGVTHLATNKGPAPFRNATIELLQNQGHPVCVKNCDNDPRAKDWPALPETAKAIGYGDTFRIIAVDIKPQQTVSAEDPFPHLGVILSDVQGGVSVPGQPAQNASHSAGEIVFHGSHPPGSTLTNSGTQDLRLVEIQFKPMK